VMSVTARYGMVAAMTLLLAGYFGLVGRRAA